MEILLLKIIFFLRPIMFIDAGVEIAGLNMFEVFAILFTCVLFLASIIHIIQNKYLHVTVVDWLIIYYFFWCLAAFFIFKNSNIKDLVKFTLPLLTFTVVKNLFTDKQRYITVLKACLLGYSIPVFWSALLIIQGKGLEKINYWTGIPRYLGVYVNPHNFGHSMALCIILIVVIYYFTYIYKTDDKLKTNKLTNFFYLLLLTAAFYCLYKSYVRTAYIGLLVFFALFVYKYNKKLFVLSSAAFLAGVLILMPLVKVIFLDVTEVVQGDRGIEKIGSGRPTLWIHNLTEFSKSDISQQLMGMGIGNRARLGTTKIGEETVYNSHNDWLEVMMQTGLGGLFIFTLIQFFIFKAILRIQGKERIVFLAFFLSVCVMNFISNSYVVRFGIAQVYYMILSYIESPAIVNNNTKNKKNILT